MEPFGMPTTKQQAQQILRRFGIRGLKIDKIEGDRIYALTGEMLHEDNTMRRQARTIVLIQEGSDIRAIHLKGWVVNDDLQWVYV